MTNEKKRSYAWVFTLNNPEHPCEYYEVLFQGISTLKYYIFQLEIGELETPHLQGYIYFKNKRVLSGIRRVFSPERLGYAKPAAGSALQNKEYCTKSVGRLEGPFEFGTIPRQGTRRDWDALYRDIHDGKKEDYLFKNHFPLMIQYMSSLQTYRLRVQRPRLREGKLTIVLGPSGTGKSKYVLEEFPLAYWQPPGEWWPGYCGEPTVVLDEFYGALPQVILSRLADRYPFYLAYKGGYTPCLVDHVVMTSNRSPYLWYKNWKNLPFESFLRRISKISIYHESMKVHREFDQTVQSIPLKEEFLAENFSH